MSDIHQTFDTFISQSAKLLKAQPPANDLDAVDTFFRNLNALYARWAALNGQAESALAEITLNAIKEMPDEEYKRIKNSSTLVTEYTRGMYPELVTRCLEIQRLGTVFRSIGENYRTLVSSYRMEREIASRTIKNTAAVTRN